MNAKLTSGVFGIGALLMASQVNAAMIQISPANLTVTTGSAFSITIQGIDFVPTNGGGFTLTWDANALELWSTAFDINSRLAFNGFIVNNVLIAPGQLDVVTSTVAPTFSAPPLSGNFDLTHLDFAGKPEGIGVPTEISFADNQPDWVDENNVDLAPALQPIYIGASITITTPEGVVPAPAAVWLFSSGLIGLIGLARRKDRA